MESAFRAWWQESYGWHVGAHAVMTHVAWGEHLLATRLKPQTLKEQALAALEDGDIGPAGASLTPVEVCIIRRALEALDD